MKKISQTGFETAILFITFNRYETTLEVFSEIKKVKPTKLYIASDGPRENNTNDKIIIQKIRSYFETNIDWECNLNLLYNEYNLGCKLGVVKAIDWFFENEEKGIILEDDVLPSEDFFTFMSFGLERYKDDSRVMMITGTNYLSDSTSKNPYFFSEHFIIWGWATWRRAWNLYDTNMTLWGKLNKEIKTHIRFKQNKPIAMDFISKFDYITYSEIDTWDIQWGFCCIINSAFCLTPKVNLISNIGEIGTHSNKVTDSHYLKIQSFKDYEYYSFIPPLFTPNYDYDLRLHKLKNYKYYPIRLIKSVLKISGLYTPLKKLKIEIQNITKFGKK